MKKLFTLVAALLTMTVAGAQTQTGSVKMEGPKLIEDFMINYVTTMGISADGTYVHGLVGGDLPGCFYNVKTEGPLWVIEPEFDASTGIQIAGITTDGIAFVSENNVAYMLNLNDSTRTDFVSPEPDLGMDIWHVTADGKYFAGNITDFDGYLTKPLYGERQEDGTYKMVALEFPELDAMGTPAQFSQARFISPDGKYVVGLQLDERGFSPRLLMWEKKADGTFELSTPLDKYIYDLSVEQPGPLPEYDDVVTADPSVDPDLYAKQDSTFTAEYTRIDSIYQAFVKGQALGAFGMSMSVKDNIVYACIEKQSDSDDFFAQPDQFPVVFNCDTKEGLINYDSKGCAFEQLPGGGYIKFDNSSMMFYKSIAVAEDGTETEFTQWLKNLTGTDISEYFTYEAENPMTGEVISDVFCGITYFSADGKSLALYGNDADMNSVTYTLTFDRDIFDIDLGVEKVNVLTAVGYKNNTVTVQGGEDARVKILGLDGVNHGEFNFTGSMNLKNVVPAGSYVAKVSTAKGNSTIKVIVK